MRTELEKRREELLHLKAEKEKSVVEAPEGSIRVSCHGGRTQYYLCSNMEEKKDRYLKNEEIGFVRQLMQKDYDEKILRSVNRELYAIERYLALLPDIGPEEVFDRLHEARKRIVEPIKMPDEEFVKRWQEVSYHGKGVFEGETRFVTKKEEMVRSKTELIIANMLYEQGIPYRYEYPLHLRGERTVYPDFCVLNVRTRKEWFWEHFGMMDYPAYAENAIKKISSYEKHGYFAGKNLITTFETKQSPIDTRQVKRIIETYLQ